MGGTVRIFAIRGIPINIHASWLVIYGLITWTLAVGYFPRALPDLHRPDKAQLLRAMEGHVLAHAQLIGTYQRGK